MYLAETTVKILKQRLKLSELNSAATITYVKVTDRILEAHPLLRFQRYVTLKLHLDELVIVAHTIEN